MVAALPRNRRRIHAKYSQIVVPACEVHGYPYRSFNSISKLKQLCVWNGFGNYGVSAVGNGNELACLYSVFDPGQSRGLILHLKAPAAFPRQIWPTRSSAKVSCSMLSSELRPLDCFFAS